VIVTILLALGINALLGEESGGGPGGTGSGEATVFEVEDVFDLDPSGDGEHPDEAELAADDDPATDWPTETYSDSITFTSKGGVGLVFDLGDAVDVSAIELRAPEGGYDISIGVAGEAGTEIDDYSVVTDRDAIAPVSTIELDETVTGRYWLILITRLPGTGTGNASIAEVSFFGN
jgi:hypothetical protein